MASIDPSRARTALTGRAWLLLGLACVLYLVMMGINCAPASTDPNTQKLDEAIGEAFGFFFTLMLWIVLAILLRAGGGAGEMRIVASILLLLSGVAAICAGVLYRRYAGWSIVVPASLPPLIALYTMWVRLPALHAALPARVINVAVDGAIVILSIAPVPLSVIDAETYAVRQRQQAAARTAAQAARDREAAEERERKIARFEALNADSPLADFLDDLRRPYFDDDPDMAHYQQALAKARQIKTRQVDVVALLEGGKIERFEDLSQLEIEATPAVCTAYGTALRREADALGNYPHLESGAHSAGQVGVKDAILRQLSNLKWLAGNGCDLDAVLTVVEAQLQDYCGPDGCQTSDFDGKKILEFLDKLAALRRPH